MSHIVIIGNGIAGITAARNIRKPSDHKITVISGETDHFYSRTALMYIYMGHMKYEHTKPYEDSFWKKNKIELMKTWVKSIDFDQKELQTEQGSFHYDKLILALGSRPNKFGWPGEDLKGVQGLYSYQDLECMEQQTEGINEAVIVGGGLIGIEMAEMLHSRNIHVTYLVREPHFWDIVLPEGESKIIERHISEYGIDLRLSTELKSINDNGTGTARSVTTSTGDEIPAQFVGLTVGVSPNIDWLQNTSLDTQKGILVNDYLETNIPDVYAIGDCAQIRTPKKNRRSIEAVWYTGRMMGETIAQTICNGPTPYDPGIWFNSAKFFDIEYQTYGYVSPQPAADEDHFFWEARDQKKAIRIAFEQGSLKVLGINTLGIRMRQEVWKDWIANERVLPVVIEELSKANFDPEFFKSYEPEIQQAFNARFSEQSISIHQPTFFQRLFN
jgi:3-phenylpropionate/trans-cinnamate dioxygenase ferredoxin reductase subunit